jgi:N-acetylmuramoyl-L-alanine amidase CwlA
MTYQAPAPTYIGPPNRHGGASNKPIRRIVIHATVSPCAKDAPGIARYFKRTDRAASAHYVVDSRKTIQALYDSFVGYHAPPNEHSLGVELCCDLSNEGKGHWGRRNHRRMLRRAAALVAGLCLAYDVPVRHLNGRELRSGKHGICGHSDVRDAWGQTTHWDPGPHFPWDDFLRMVRQEVDKIQGKGGRHKRKRNEPSVSLRRLQNVAHRARWSRAYWKTAAHDVKIVSDALRAEGMPNYITWQRSLGYRGDDADGVPGEVSLKTLGRKRGFRVER